MLNALPWVGMDRGQVIPADAGIQSRGTTWMPVPVSSLVPYLIRERDKLRGNDHHAARAVW